jgi:hypothetical protein
MREGVICWLECSIKVFQEDIQVLFCKLILGTVRNEVSVLAEVCTDMKEGFYLDLR